MPTPTALRYGNHVGNQYVISFRVGQGKAGGAVYGAKDPRAPAMPLVAVKFPVSPSELEALQKIQELAPECLGVPRLLSFGTHVDHPYIVMDMFGHSISRVFKGLRAHQLEVRWAVVSILGRLLLRRLEAVHRCGFVHCDLQPENILVGRPDAAAAAEKAGDIEAAVVALASPYLVDFGWARRFPGGGILKDYHGSIDFISIRSAAGPAERGPHDDLESLGWLLCHGLFGELPWFQLTKDPTIMWQGGRPSSSTLCQRVQESKARFLDLAAAGHSGRPPGTSRSELSAALPRGLCDFLCSCRSQAADAPLPGYTVLAALMDGDGRGEARREETLDKAEQEDLRLFHAYLTSQDQPPADLIAIRAPSVPIEGEAAHTGASAETLEQERDTLFEALIADECESPQRLRPEIEEFVLRFGLGPPGGLWSEAEVAAHMQQESLHASIPEPATPEEPERQELRAGIHASVTSSREKLETECRTSGLSWPDDQRGVPRAEKLGLRGRIDDVDFSDSTVCLGDGIKWVPIRALVGFEEWGRSHGRTSAGWRASTAQPLFRPAAPAAPERNRSGYAVRAGPHIR